MTTIFNVEDLKRKFDSEESRPQKLLKRSSTDQLSDFFSDQFSLPYEDDEEDFDDEMIDNINEESLNQQQEHQPEQQQEHKEQEQKQQQPTPPQRKKPGRKPNPASPALRKAQNRAAQRAFRERKERHLRELENTIKALRESQYESLVKCQREYSHYRSLIEQLEAENSFLKEIAFTFECALNNINGNNEATTKMKNAVSQSIPRTSVPSSLPLNGNGVSMIGSIATSPFGLNAMQLRQANLPSQLSVPTAQQIQNNYLGLLQSQATVNGRALNINITSPVTNNIVMSPNGSGNISTASVSSSSSPQTPESIIPGSISPSSTFFAEEFAREITLADMKPFVSQNSGLQIGHESSSLFADGNTNVYNSTSSSIYKTDDIGTLSSSQAMIKSDSTSSTISSVSSNSNNNSTISVNNNNNLYMAEAASMIDNDADYFSAYIFNDESIDESNYDFNTPEQNVMKKKLTKDQEQLLRLSKKVGQTVLGPVNPKIRIANQ
ncbi:basic-leucine zipper transcription factor [Rhizophagus clarus]|uniref:Basic-leucine zipper transcription factor n=1 Tax=Rhizophagus clarus TaxID=94130 RepID=A0A8H3LMK4_9GLOM|nr:basic-leucine zipper transcription factor [Rhizophagus clarus]